MELSSSDGGYGDGGESAAHVRGGDGEEQPGGAATLAPNHARRPWSREREEWRRSGRLTRFAACW